ncbi:MULTISPECIES: hypothetical protein [unclassified Pseudactinotalea]|uniref:hypothetical protein n=1 Tax=unclassified Pseudactinotalea TaxID=2649176 RepID=UPI00128DCB4E|nr:MULTISPECIES: hypothetical protein [unclassified Pseudactinotalea]MPV50448.1 hypothetical protein [Pseudactinotalea sp. HY160]QGH70527.1 hypothetical protein GCE65_14270 [Pseudactinotalea sp. HY158]
MIPTPDRPAGPERPEVPGLDEIPADVVLARGARALLQALLLSIGMVVLLALVTLAAIALAGPQRTGPMITAGQIVTAWAAALALVGAIVCGRGHLEVLRDSPDPRGVAAVLAATQRRLAWLPRLVVAGCIVAVTIWVLIDSAGFVGALVASAVAVQVPVVLGFVRRDLLAPARLAGPPQLPLRERIRRAGR